MTATISAPVWPWRSAVGDRIFQKWHLLPWCAGTGVGWRRRDTGGWGGVVVPGSFWHIWPLFLVGGFTTLGKLTLINSVIFLGGFSNGKTWQSWYYHNHKVWCVEMTMMKKMEVTERVGEGILLGNTSGESYGPTIWKMGTSEQIRKNEDFLSRSENPRLFCWW